MELNGDLRFESRNLILARQIRQLTQAELSEEARITQGTLSKIENGTFVPAEDAVTQIGNALSFPNHFFYQDLGDVRIKRPLFRRRLSLTKKQLDACCARIQLFLFQIRRLLQSAEIPSSNVFNVDLHQINSGIQQIAKLLRVRWKLSQGPIGDLISLAEDNGCIVIPFDFKTRLVDGCSCYLDSTPIIFVNKLAPVDRQRFTIAHELGHLIMHVLDISEEAEFEANVFAAEFLMPQDDIISSFYPFSIDRLARLKLHWKVSMQALLKRASDLRVLSDRQARYYWMQLNRMGFRESEPHSDRLPKEKATTLSELIDVHRSDLGWNWSKLSDYLCVWEDDARAHYALNEAYLTVVK